jgi:hypothetical protein
MVHKLLQSARAGAGIQKRAATRMNGTLSELVETAGVIKATLQLAGRRVNKGKTALAMADIDALRQRIVEMATRLRRLRTDAEVMADTASSAFTSLDEVLKHVNKEGKGKRAGGTILHELSAVRAGLRDSTSTWITGPGCVPCPQPPTTQS